MNQVFENGNVFGLRWWRALIVFTIASVATMFTVVAMREGLGWPVPQWVGSGLGGVFGVIAVTTLAARRRAKAIREEERARR